MYRNKALEIAHQIDLQIVIKAHRPIVDIIIPQKEVIQKIFRACTLGDDIWHKYFFYKALTFILQHEVSSVKKAKELIDTMPVRDWTEEEKQSWLLIRTEHNSEFLVHQSSYVSSLMTTEMNSCLFTTISYLNFVATNSFHTEEVLKIS